MTKITTLLVILTAASVTGGCAGFQRAIGGTKAAPDEFRVVTQAPLTLPPDYNLRPPRPGEPRPQELAPDAEARAALFGDEIGQAASPGERTLVASAGAGAIDPNIRDTIDFEAQGIVRRNESFVNRVLAFGGQSVSTPLSPEDEARRLEDEESIRRTTGGGQVVIQRNAPGGFKLPGT